MRKRTAEWSDSLVKQQRWITERGLTWRRPAHYKIICLIFCLIPRLLNGERPDYVTVLQIIVSGLSQQNEARRGCFHTLLKTTGMVTQREASWPSSPFHLLRSEDTLYFSLAQRRHAEKMWRTTQTTFCAFTFSRGNTQSLPWDPPPLTPHWVRTKHADPEDAFELVRPRVLRAKTDSWQAESVSVCSVGYLVLHHRA